jgi:hypothetical protein
MRTRAFMTPRKDIAHLILCWINRHCLFGRYSTAMQPPSLFAFMPGTILLAITISIIKNCQGAIKCAKVFGLFICLFVRSMVSALCALVFTVGVIPAAYTGPNITLCASICSTAFHLFGHCGLPVFFVLSVAIEASFAGNTLPAPTVIHTCFIQGNTLVSVSNASLSLISYLGKQHIVIYQLHGRWRAVAPLLKLHHRLCREYDLLFSFIPGVSRT